MLLPCLILFETTINKLIFRATAMDSLFNPKYIQYNQQLKQELDSYFQHLDTLFQFTELIGQVKTWQFSKKSTTVYYPHLYHDELMGYQTGKLTRKKFHSLEEACRQEYILYGLADHHHHILTISASSKQFGTTCQFFLYDQSHLIKMMTVRYLHSYFKGNTFHLSKERSPDLSGIRYFFWLSETEQMILTRGKANQNGETITQKIIYQNHMPYQYHAYSDSMPMSFHFIYQDTELNKIQHTDSEYCLFERKIRKKI